MKHEITFKAAKILSEGGYPIYRGAREVLVNGHTWGFLDCKFVGCHGTKYTLCQVIDYSECHWDTIMDNDRKRPSAKYTEWSDKQYKFHVDPQAPRQSLDERLLTMVQTAIRKNDLRDPVDVRQTRLAELEKWKADRLQDEHIRDVRIYSKASELVERVRKSNDGEAVEEVLAVMKWAKENA